MAERDKSGDEEGKRRENGSSDDGPRRAIPSVQVIGWAFVLLVLAGYFAWMIMEMGAHAVTHAYPMIAVLVAAIVGAGAATLGVVLGRRSVD